MTTNRHGISGGRSSPLTPPDLASAASTLPMKSLPPSSNITLGASGFPASLTSQGAGVTIEASEIVAPSPRLGFHGSPAYESGVTRAASLPLPLAASDFRFNGQHDAATTETAVTSFEQMKHIENPAPASVSTTSWSCEVTPTPSATFCPSPAPTHQERLATPTAPYYPALQHHQHKHQASSLNPTTQFPWADSVPNPPQDSWHQEPAAFPLPHHRQHQQHAQMHPQQHLHDQPHHGHVSPQYQQQRVPPWTPTLPQPPMWGPAGAPLACPPRHMAAHLYAFANVGAPPVFPVTPAHLTREVRHEMAEARRRKGFTWEDLDGVLERANGFTEGIFEAEKMPTWQDLKKLAWTLDIAFDRLCLAFRV